MKKFIALCLSLLMLLSYMPVMALDVDDEDIVNIDFGVATPRQGEHPSDEMWSAAGQPEKYFADCIQWYDSEHKPLGKDYTFTQDEYYYLSFRAYTDEYYYFATDGKAECFVNGITAEAKQNSDSNEQFYEVKLLAYAENIIDMFKITINANPGLTGKDLEQLVTIGSPHLDFTPATKANGIRVTNLTNPKDTDGVLKEGNNYRLEFGVIPDRGENGKPDYQLAPYGTVVANGCYCIDADWELHIDGDDGINWEPYTGNGTSAVAYIAVDVCSEVTYDKNEDSELITDKEVTETDGTITVDLSAFCETLNARIKYSCTPCDIVLLIDTSNSMTNYRMSNGKTRLAVLKETCNSFIDGVYERASIAGVDHRIAIVSFDSKAHRLTGTKDSNAFLNVTSNLNTLKNTITNLSTNGSTRTDYGFDAVSSVMAANNDDRQKVVVFLTDGVPATYQDEFDTSFANSAINISNTIKNVYNAKVYSVGINVDADPRTKLTANPRTITEKMNTFMHFVSSNYPNAVSMSDGGEKDTSGYFITASEAEKLDEIFAGIIDEQISNTVFFNDFIFRDTLSKYFTLTTLQENALRESLYAEYGLTPDDVTVTRNADGTTDIQMRHLFPKPVYENNRQSGWQIKVSYEASANENAVKGGTYPVESSERSVVKDSLGETIATFDRPDDVLPGKGRAIVIFSIDNKVYHIESTAIGNPMPQRQDEGIVWNMPKQSTVSNEITRISGNFTTEKRSVTFNVGDDTYEEEFYIGQTITVPEFETPEGFIFGGWDDLMPVTMGSENLTFNATLIPHEHDFELITVSGKCTEGISRTYQCRTCLEKKTENDAPCDHSYEARISTVNDESVAGVICTRCGDVYQEDTVINYKASTGAIMSYIRTFELTLEEENTAVQPDGKIIVKVALDSSLASKSSLYVFRINEDGTREKVDCEKKGDFLYLYLDHFSIYAVTDSEEAPPQEEAQVYNEIVCEMNHSGEKLVYAGANTFEKQCAECGRVLGTEKGNLNSVTITGSDKAKEVTVYKYCDIAFSAETAELPRGVTVKWYKGSGHNANLIGEGKDFTLENVKGNCAIHSELVDKDGKTVLAKSDEIKVKVTQTFFRILWAWFMRLFNKEAILTEFCNIK